MCSIPAINLTFYSLFLLLLNTGSPLGYPRFEAIVCPRFCGASVYLWNKKREMERPRVCLRESCWFWELLLVSVSLVSLIAKQTWVSEMWKL